MVIHPNDEDLSFHPREHKSLPRDPGLGDPGSERWAPRKAYLRGESPLRFCCFCAGDESPAYLNPHFGIMFGWRSKPKWVVSRSLKEVGADSIGPSATLVAEDVEGAIGRLKGELEGEIGVAGQIWLRRAGAEPGGCRLMDGWMD